MNPDSPIPHPVPYTTQAGAICAQKKTFSYVILMEYLINNYRVASDFCVHSDKFINISGLLYNPTHALVTL